MLMQANCKIFIFIYFSLHHNCQIFVFGIWFTGCLHQSKVHLIIVFPNLKKMRNIAFLNKHEILLLMEWREEGDKIKFWNQNLKMCWYSFKTRNCNYFNNYQFILIINQLNLCKWLVVLVGMGVRGVEMLYFLCC